MNTLKWRLTGIAWLLVGLLVLRYGAGYHPVWNVGEYLRGHLFLCRPMVQEKAIPRGAIIHYAPPARVQALVVAMAPDADLQAPWLKRAVAVDGDEVCWVGQRLLVNRAVVAELDRRIARLALAHPCLRLEPWEVLPLGDAPDSFDGRYHGPLGLGEVSEVCQRVW